LNGEANSARKKHRSATIVAEVMRFCYAIKTDEVFNTHSYHLALTLGDSITPSIRMTFSVHTGVQIAVADRKVASTSLARAVLFINSFEYNDPAEFERADDLLIRRPNAGKNHADR
jgi:hypothetical protein